MTIEAEDQQYLTIDFLDTNTKILSPEAFRSQANACAILTPMNWAQCSELKERRQADSLNRSHLSVRIETGRSNASARLAIRVRTTKNQISKFRTSSAWVWMKRLRGGTRSPISIVKVSSACCASSSVT